MIKTSKWIQNRPTSGNNYYLEVPQVRQNEFLVLLLLLARGRSAVLKKQFQQNSVTCSTRKYRCYWKLILKPKVDEVKFGKCTAILKMNSHDAKTCKFKVGALQKRVNLVDLEHSRAKIGFDTAKNGPSKILSDHPRSPTPWVR